MINLRPVALDLTRLALAPVRRAPRGIDRVELAYADHFIRRWTGDCVAVLPMPWGVRCYSRKMALRFLNAVKNHWRENAEPGDDHVFESAKRFLAGRQTSGISNLRRAKPGLMEQSVGYLSLLLNTGISFGRAADRYVPEKAVYLNVGQLEVYAPFLSWLKKRPDVRPIFMIHDLIPLELPEHHLPIGIKLHERIVSNTAKFAEALIVPSSVVANAVRMELSAFQRESIPMHVEHLALGDEFLLPVQSDPDLAGRNYFVVCGAIDSYKNHILLLRVWRKLVHEQGASAPKLIIAGSPGVTSRSVLWFLEHYSAELSNHVMLASGLATPSLRALVSGARALLMPSLAEGFGLPIIEALAQGTPVLASDTPAHREVATEGRITFLDAADDANWLETINALSSEPGSRSSGLLPKTWQKYFEGVEAFLGG